MSINTIEEKFSIQPGGCHASRQMAHAIGHGMALQATLGRKDSYNIITGRGPQLHAGSPCEMTTESRFLRCAPAALRAGATCGMEKCLVQRALTRTGFSGRSSNVADCEVAKW